MGQVIRKLDDLAGIVVALQSAGKKVVYTSGVFDLLHTGTLRALVDAKSRGHYLVVGVQTDVSLESRLGEGRPFVAQKDRAELVAALDPVDYVTFADLDAEPGTVEVLKPDLLALGVDASPTVNQDKKAVHALGGRYVTVTSRKGISLAQLLRRIQAASDGATAGRSSKSAKKKAASKKASTKKGTKKKAAKKATSAKSSAAQSKSKSQAAKAKSRATKVRSKKGRTARKPELVGAS